MNQPIHPGDRIEFDLPACNDIGELLIVYIQISKDHDVFLEILCIQNTSNHREWQMGCYSWLGANSMSCCLGGFYWAHRVSTRGSEDEGMHERASSECLRVLEVTTDEAFDPIRDKPFLVCF